MQRLQAVELDILKVIDKLCRENDIDYFIDSGTCLGAMRHGGFIPWDDDVDVGMPIEDYDRFCEIAPTLLPEGYSLHVAENTQGFSALWAKVYKDGTRFIDDNCDEAGCEQAIFVDVLPYCRLDANEKKARRQCRKARLTQMKSYLKHFSRPKVPENVPARPLMKLACKLVHHTIAHMWKQEDLERTRLHIFDSDNPSNTWTCAVYTNFGSFDDATLFPTRDMVFEGVTLRAPNDVNTYLKTMYGDYMQLPPESNRYTHAPVILDFGDGINVLEAISND